MTRTGSEGASRLTTKESARKFQFLREIASGGFGSVYLAKVVHADGFSRLVAVKLLHRRWSENEEIASRMRDEARLLGWLRHRNIVDVMDLTLIDGRCAVIMEYLEAVDTRVIVENCRDAGTKLPLSVALEVTAAVASALDAAYNRPPYAGEKPLHVIHRDIKPSNIMLDEQGVVKVLDFGVARAEFDAREAKTAELSFGSLEYMPPERLFFEPESPASDVYSLGTTLYELLALEKLGKAKLRQSEQTKFIDQRFEDLLAVYPVDSQEIEDELGTILREMLAFDESDRISAADCVTRMRALARQLGHQPLEEWAEGHIPALITLVREREEDDGATLVGKVITEDISGFWEDSTVGESDEPPDSGPQPIPKDLGEESVDVPDSAEFTTGRDDERWSALKEATLASLSETGELSQRTVEEVRKLSPAAVAEWLADDTTDPDDAMPTVRIQTGDFGGDDDDLGDAAVFDESDDDDDDDEALDADGGVSTGTEFILNPAAGVDNEAETEALRPELPPMAPPPQQQAPRPPASPPPEEGGSSLVSIIAGLLFVGLLVSLVLGIVVILGAGLVAVYVSMSTPSTVVIDPMPVDPEPIEVPEPADPVPADPVPEDPVPEDPVPEDPVPEDPDPTATELPEGATLFVSELDGTVKMSVRCESGSFSGETETLVEGGSPGKCTVVAVDASRKRRTAVVEAVEPRRYVCFGDGGSDCQ